MKEDYQVKLYRLTDDVINEIQQSLSFWNKHSILKNPLLVERAIRDVSQTYSVVDMSSDTTEVVPKDDIKSNTNTNDVMNAVTLQNTLQAFEQFLDKVSTTVQNDESKSKVAELVKNTYKTIVLETLKN